MRLTVLGGGGVWPEPGRPCGGYLIEQDGFRLLVDPGHATVPQLLRWVTAAEVDAVYVSHGHPDHCADLNPLLRARALRDEPADPLPVYSPSGAVDAVLALDRPGLLAYSLPALPPETEIGPFRVRTWQLPHSVPNAGVRLEAGGRALAYTGDCGPSARVVELAGDADLLLAEATFVDEVPEDVRASLSSARMAGLRAAEAGAGRLLLTHLQPGTAVGDALSAASDGYAGEIDVATTDLVIDLR